MNNYKRIGSKILLVPVFGQIGIHSAEAHLEHLPHYNAGESRIGYGNYMSYIALDPDYGTTDYPTKITYYMYNGSANATRYYSDKELLPKNTKH